MTQFRKVCLALWRMKFARQDTLGRQTEDFSEKINFRKKNHTCLDCTKWVNYFKFKFSRWKLIVKTKAHFLDNLNSGISSNVFFKYQNNVRHLWSDFFSHIRDLIGHADIFKCRIISNWKFTYREPLQKPLLNFSAKFEIWPILLAFQKIFRHGSKSEKLTSSNTGGHRKILIKFLKTLFQISVQ